MMVFSKNYKMYARKNIILICAFLLVSCQNYSNTDHNKTIENQLGKINIPDIYFGKFSAGVNTEATTTGKASLTYNFVVTKSVVMLSTNSYHEPIRCNGNYNGKLNNHILELYYDGIQQNCKSDDPNFKIKKVGQKFFVQGLGGEGTFNEWVELQKK